MKTGVAVGQAGRVEMARGVRICQFYGRRKKIRQQVGTSACHGLGQGIPKVLPMTSALYRVSQELNPGKICLKNFVDVASDSESSLERDMVTWC